MKKLVCLLITCISLCACDILVTKTPVEYFDIAALNCNMFMHFGSKQIKEQLSEKRLVYNEVTKKSYIATTYKENVEKFLIARVESNFKEVKALKITEDTKLMIEKSIGLYNYVLDKYKSSYVTIAQMKDDHKPEADIEKAMADFDAAYLPAYDEKYNSFLDVSLAFAKRNDIPVNTF